MIVLWAVNEQQKHSGEECKGKAKIHSAAGGRTVMDIEGKKTILKSQLTIFLFVCFVKLHIGGFSYSYSILLKS